MECLENWRKKEQARQQVAASPHVRRHRPAFFGGVQPSTEEDTGGEVRNCWNLLRGRRLRPRKAHAPIVLFLGTNWYVFQPIATVTDILRLRPRHLTINFIPMIKYKSQPSAETVDL